MRLDNYYSEVDGKTLISPQQASDFAKSVAGDFNPLHDVDSKRFCVPGDLLFALALAKFGLSQKMRITFLGMVGKDVPLDFSDTSSGEQRIVDENGKEYLSVEREGSVTTDETLIRDLVCRYVEFSGHTYPDILIPLLSGNNVMVNPDRPLIIYQSMSINLDHLDFAKPGLELSNASLSVSGRRGDARLKFNLTASGEVVGNGEKKFAISGLRELDRDVVQRSVDSYNRHKEAFSG
ncbi:MAG: DUF3581 family protein [Pseudomonadota bacterium]|nr:DUF3581 family protein [Pseudomonadota bacterium]